MNSAATRVRVVVSRFLEGLGFQGDTFFLAIAVVVGVVTAAAAVGFHELIRYIRDVLYQHLGPTWDMYGTGMVVLIVWPMLGGLVVGITSRYIIKAREGHGIVDVMESVIRSSGFERPSVALEKIFTSGVTIGSGGSTGAEGPIVQIGAAIASGVGQMFSLARHQMPLLIGCGSAAGISAIFNAPIGGVLFTLEVILQDFSIRAFAPVVLASVVANVTTQAIFQRVLHSQYQAIFALPDALISGQLDVSWRQLPNFILLGALCGMLAATFTRMMHFWEGRFAKLKLTKALKPAAGGMLLGIMGVFYVVLFGHIMLGQPKPIPASVYPLPAFFSDGYGFIQVLFGREFYAPGHFYYLAGLLGFLILAKLLGTCLTLCSGGSGGIIAPSLFLGAVLGGLLGMTLRHLGIFAMVQPEVYALVGMAAVLAAVIHAPLASILILLELTRDYKLMLPAMLAAVVATGVGRLMVRDSLYTMGLRRRGIHVGRSKDMMLLRRMMVEQVELEPASYVRQDDPLQRALELCAEHPAGEFVVVDEQGQYAGMLVAEDINVALMAREAVPLLVVREITRGDVPVVCCSDDLAKVLELFSCYKVARLPVCVSRDSRKVVGLISQAGLMQRYQAGLAET